MVTRRITLVLGAFVLTAAASTGRGKLNAQATRAPLPPAVVTAEGLAEDIQTQLDSSRWTAAGTTLVRLQANRSALRTAVVSDSHNVAAYDSWLDSLATQVGRRERLASLRSANQLSRVLLSISTNYDLTVPVEVGRMDVAGRDAIYRAESGDWQGVAASVAELRNQYAVVQAHVATKDATLSARVTQRLAALDAAVSARNAAAVRSAATRLLDDVDLIERAY